MGKYRKAVQQKKNSKKQYDSNNTNIKQKNSKKQYDSNNTNIKQKNSKKQYNSNKTNIKQKNERKKYNSNETNIKQKNSKKYNNNNKLSSDDDSDFEVAPEQPEEHNVATVIENINENQLNENEPAINTRDLVKIQNKKNKKSGGFQSFGLSYHVFKGVMNKGYKVPTPIQRKTIPLIMDGLDVVAMARTGSGKTAAFLVPMFEKLKTHSTKGIRGLILSPTRELAVQTMKFTRELGKFTDLKSTLILGGDSMENQFASLHQNPDILIASPGRLLHLLVEMDIKCLDAIEYVVFDEADRLFEMGFAEQLQEIIKRLPDTRQTVLFSATLPKLLVDFASAGLTNPTLIRLDVDTKISDKLKMSFFLMRPDDKAASLLHLLQAKVSKEEQTLVFLSTKHHVDFIHQLLQDGGYSSTYIYSSLDQTARKINLAKFRKKLCMILLVTDIAARGIDIPMLDNVINYDFPAKPKVFVHRVGRVARAGQSGNSFSFLTKDEMSFYFDLHLFLGRPTKLATSSSKKDDDGLLGCIPQSCLTDEIDFIRNRSAINYNLVAMQKVMSNGYKQYLKSREPPSQESIKRSKSLDISAIYPHPMLGEESNTSNDLSKLLSDLKKFKPNVTVFEAMNTKKSKSSEVIMKMKRLDHNEKIERFKLKLNEKPIIDDEDNTEDKNPEQTVVDNDYIANAFNIKPKTDKRDKEHYIPNVASDRHEEKGFNVNSFEKEASKFSLDLKTDDGEKAYKNMQTKKWDRKRKKFVSTEGSSKQKKIKTESGRYIAASYKTNAYSDWMKRNNHMTSTNEDEADNKNYRKFNDFQKNLKAKYKTKVSKKSKGTLKTKDQIVKQRMHAERKKFQSKRGHNKKKR